MSKPFTEDELSKAMEMVVSENEATEGVMAYASGDFERILKVVKEQQEKVNAIIVPAAQELLSQRGRSFAMTEMLTGAEMKDVYYNALLTGLLIGVNLCRNQKDELTFRLVYDNK